MNPIFTMTCVIAGLLIASSVGGLLYGSRGWYDDDAMLPVLLGQDAIVLGVIVPALFAFAWYARRGSMSARLFWMGLLFYLAYFYYFYVVGIRFNPLFPIYIAIVSMGMYGSLWLFIGIDDTRFEADARPDAHRKLYGGFLIALAVVFAVMWLGMVVTHLLDRADLPSVSRFVIAIDGVVLLPLAMVAGLRVLNRRSHGLVLTGLILTKSLATFFTLLGTTLMAWIWGEQIKAGETFVYLVSFVCVLAILTSYLRDIAARPAVHRRTS